MNNKGFTLIELVVTIVILAIIMSVSTISVVGTIQKTKEKSYEILIENIKTGAQSYYEECENKNILDTNINCNGMSVTNKTLKTTIGDLLNYGFVTSTATREDTNGNEIKIVENPKDNKNINDCKITIKKEVDSNFKVTYKITQTEANTNCPTY